MSIENGRMKKDLMPMLEKWETNDKFFLVDLLAEKLLAPQKYTRKVLVTKDPWGKITRVESTQTGSPSGLAAPSRRKKVRQSEGETKDGFAWTFLEQQVDGTKQIELPVGGAWGFVKQCFRRTLEAQRKMRYDYLPLNLIKTYPRSTLLGPAPCDSIVANTVEVVLETRHTQTGDKMVEAYFDFAKGRKIRFVLERDSACPIGDEKLTELVKTLNTLENIGASGRGSVQVTGMWEINLSKNELDILRGDDVREVSKVLEDL